MEAAYLRAAAEEDMELLFEWANEAVVRANSFSTSRITYEEHKAWYRKLLSREDCRQYIYMYNGQAVGQVRVSVSGVEAEIGYSVCAGMRGMGHGKHMLALLYEQIARDYPQVQKLTAKVKPGNAASAKAFSDTGYIKKYEAYELDIKR